MRSNLDEILIRRLEAEQRRLGMSEPVRFRSEIRNDEVAKYFRGNSIEMPPALAREFAEWISRQLKFGRTLGHEDREVLVTPFPGHYGLAGYVITVNGSPPRGMMVATFGGSCGPSVALTRDGCKFVSGDPCGSPTSARRYREGMSFIERLKLSCTPGSSPANPSADVGD